MSKVLTTHTGSLPRPRELIELIAKRQKGEYDEETYWKVAKKAVKDIVKKQADIGLDIINDGEQPRPAYSFYITDRIEGFKPGVNPLKHLFEEAAKVQKIDKSVTEALSSLPDLTCQGELRYTDEGKEELRRNIEAFKEALEAVDREVKPFFTAVSPRTAEMFLPNGGYYETSKEYVEALGRELRKEYLEIVKAGFILQLDCPDIPTGLRGIARALTREPEDFAEKTNTSIQVLNNAISGIQPEKLRVHACWGNDVGSHVDDASLEDVLPYLYKINVKGLSFVGANPRHEWEWTTFKKHPLPNGKAIIPGVVCSLCTVIEHPRTIAQRAERYASAVGRDKVTLGSDCGFATMYKQANFPEEAAWQKLEALVSGAKIFNQS